MNTRNKLRHLLAAVLVGVLVGGGLMATTPAGAEMAQVATSWKKIWKKNLRPLADKRYYKKADSDARYASSSALADFYSKAQSDARYAGAGTSYPKAESDARYAGAGTSYSKADSDGRYVGKLALRQGGYFIADQAAGAGAFLSDSISYGIALSAPPTPHFIPAGAPVPAGCLGTPAAPNAQPGHLCVFETVRANASEPGIYTLAGGLGTSTMGAILTSGSAGAGQAYSAGTWAVRPAAVAASARPTEDRTGNFGIR